MYYKPTLCYLASGGFYHIVFGAIMLYNEISFYVSKFIVMVIKKIAKYSLSKTNKINLFVHLLQIVFEIPLWIYIF